MMPHAIARILLVICTMLSQAAITLYADDFKDPYADYDETAALDMEIEENLATPVIQQPEKAPIVKYMTALAHQLKQRYKVETMRAGEVIVVTIPSDDLFLPNDTLLSPDAPSMLRPLLPLFRDPDLFKLVYAVHTDNTGSPEYIDNLASARNQSIYAWLMDVAKVNPDLFIINYDMGDSRPLTDNNSRANRALNRRIEFFLVPGPKLITLAHTKKLK